MSINYQMIIDKMPSSIFRAYDIRGVVGKTLTADIVYTIALAIGSEAQKRGSRDIIVGRDGRISGPELSAALVSGLRASGCNVINLGEITTPVLYYATFTLNTNSGVMLTGSHNPPDNNGIKMVLAGETIFGEAIQDLYKRILAKDFLSGFGQESHITDMITRYQTRILSDIKLDRPLKVVIDCGNGVGGLVAPELFTKMGCEVIPLFCEVDGNFPNHQADPAVLKNLENLIQAVKERKADLGLAFDGDADRIGVVTDQGKVIFPDRLLMYFAIDILMRHPGATIVYDVKGTSYLEKIITEHGGKPYMSPTGHSFVKACMKKTGALLAGELSGHIFLKERWFGFDDGIYTAARLVEILSHGTLTSSQAFATIPECLSTPEIKIPIPDDKKFLFIEKLLKNTAMTGAKITTIDGLRADFKDGFGLVRASNTTPYLIARFEAQNEPAMQRIQKMFHDKLLTIDASLRLSF